MSQVLTFTEGVCLKQGKKYLKGGGLGCGGRRVSYSFLLASEKTVEVIKVNLRDASSTLALCNSPPVRGSSEILRKITID